MVAGAGHPLRAGPATMLATIPVAEMWVRVTGFCPILQLTGSPPTYGFTSMADAGHLLPAGPATMLATVPVAAGLALLARYLITNRLLEK